MAELELAPNGAIESIRSLVLMDMIMFIGSTFKGEVILLLLLLFFVGRGYVPP